MSEKYMPVMNIGNRSDLTLVRDNKTGKLFVSRVINDSQLQMYRALQSIHCQNIPQIIEILNCDNETYKVIEEYIDGKTLDEYIRNNNLLSEEDAAFYICELCDILIQIHRAGIIHRDIKPSNIIITEENKLYLIDFDISRVHKNNKNLDTALLGTKGYAAPEQFGFSQTDVRTDIYAVGVLLNRLITGKLPIEQIPKTSIKKIISKCVDIDPQRRYQSAKSLKAAISVYSPRNYTKAMKVLRHIVGFRTLKPWKMVISSLVYFLLIFSILISVPDFIKSPAIGIVCLLSFIPYILLFCYIFDCFGFRSKILWIKKANTKFKYIMRNILYGIFLFVIANAIICIPGVIIIMNFIN